MVMAQDQTDSDKYEGRSLVNKMYGTDWDLEEEADRILADYRREHPVISEEEYLVLSKGQMDRRSHREILNKQSYPEAHLYSGLYKRVYNPQIGKRPRSGTVDRRMEQDFE